MFVREKHVSDHFGLLFWPVWASHWPSAVPGKGDGKGPEKLHIFNHTRFRIIDLLQIYLLLHPHRQDFWFTLSLLFSIRVPCSSTHWVHLQWISTSQASCRPILVSKLGKRYISAIRNQPLRDIEPILPLFTNVAPWRLSNVNANNPLRHPLLYSSLPTYHTFSWWQPKVSTRGRFLRALFKAWFSGSPTISPKSKTPEGLTEVKLKFLHKMYFWL